MIGNTKRKSYCWSCSIAESIFGNLKTDRVFFPKYRTGEGAGRDIVDYVEIFYNSKLRHFYLDYVSLIELKASWFQKMLFN